MRVPTGNITPVVRFIAEHCEAIEVVIIVSSGWKMKKQSFHTGLSDHNFCVCNRRRDEKKTDWERMSHSCLCFAAGKDVVAGPQREEVSQEKCGTES